jgi:sarcosine oxidase subunit beta
MELVDAVVIGGGVYGASITFSLVDLGLRPVLLERHHLASGPTGRSSANVRVHYLRRELAELTRRSIEVFRTFRERTGGDCGLVESGFAFLLGDDDAAAWSANATGLRNDGFEIEQWTADEVERLLPGADLAGVRMAVVEPRGGYADPVATTVGFATAAATKGATVRTGATVARVEVVGGRVAGVDLVGGWRVAADRVMVAAGPWTRALVAPLDVDLPLHAERHPIAVVDAHGRARDVLPVVLADLDRDYYARPEGRDTILVGSRDRYPPWPDLDAVDETVGLEEGSALAGRLASRMPVVGDLGVRPGWAALYDCSVDRTPIVDAVPGVEGLFVCCGTSGHGFKMAPALGEQAARLVAGLPTELLHPFRMDRDMHAVGRDLGGIVRGATG